MRPRFVALAATSAALGFLLARLAGDVHGKPLFEDEAVAGLIGARPFGEIVVTSLWDRGGAPLHFVLAHLTFLLDPSPAALRWLSVVFALAALPLCYDLGRRLGGATAGITAALVAAASGMLAVYGSFGRMYALLAFAGALAADLFVRAVQRPTAGTAAAAAAAAWLLPAVHPYGGVVVAFEALVALALWRGRPLRPALPVAAIGLAMVPFAVADFRLAGRFEVGAEAERRLATREEAWSQLESAARGFAGGEGVTFLVLLALAAAGIVVLARRQPAFVAFACLALLAPPVLSTLVRTGRAPDLSPRHLIYALPFWAAFVGVGVARAVREAGRLPKAAALAGVGILAAFSPQGIHDPRSVTYTAFLGRESFVAAPAEWLRDTVEEGDILFPYSSVFLAGLPETGKATALPRAQAGPILEALERIEFPVGNVFVAVPLSRATVRLDAVRQRLGPGFEVRQFGTWLLLRARGPFEEPSAALQAAAASLAATEPTLGGVVHEALVGWFDLNLAVLCEALARLDSECVTE